MTYLDNLCALHDGAYDSRIEQSADILLSHIDADSVIMASKCI